MRPASYYMNQGVDGRPLPSISDRLRSMGMDSSVENRPMIMPIREDGEWIAPEWFHSIARGAMVPVQTVLGGTVTPADAAMAVVDYTSGGLLASKAIPNAVPDGSVLGATVWHGSPHSFKKFRMDKIGTGEGAQSYGHGLYFAENPAVAKTHLGDLPHIQWKKIRDSINLDVDRGYVARRPDGTEKVFANESDAWGWVKDAMGNLYKVDIPDEHIGKMFDWDKPLRGQGEEVLKLADKYGVSHNADGGTLLESMSANLRSKALASDEIKELGFPGIKYLDQFSRGKYHVQLKYKGEPYGEPVELLAKNQVDDFVKEYEAKGFGTEVVEKGTSNFVLFDDQIPQILEVNDKSVRGILSGR